MFHYLDIDLIKQICHPMTVAYFDKEEEPIASFREHDIFLLDSAINSPKHTYDGVDLYQGITEKSAILFYSMISNHPFSNGNKRIATASLLVFLYINNYWLKENKQIELADWAIRIARAGEENIKKDDIFPELVLWLKESIINYTK